MHWALMPSRFPEHAICRIPDCQGLQVQGVHGFFGGGARRNEQNLL